MLTEVHIKINFENLSRGSDSTAPGIIIPSRNRHFSTVLGLKVLLGTNGIEIKSFWLNFSIKKA